MMFTNNANGQTRFIVFSCIYRILLLERVEGTSRHIMKHFYNCKGNMHAYISVQMEKKKTVHIEITRQLPTVDIYSNTLLVFDTTCI